MSDARDTIVRAAAAIVGSEDRHTQRRAAKALLVTVWGLMPAHERRLFIQRTGLPPNYDFMTFEKRWPELDDPELESAARSWSYVSEGLSKNDLGFAQSVAKLLRQRRKPSDKQIQWMKQLYKNWLTFKDTTGEVIE